MMNLMFILATKDPTTKWSRKIPAKHLKKPSTSAYIPAAPSTDVAPIGHSQSAAGDGSFHGLPPGDSVTLCRKSQQQLGPVTPVRPHSQLQGALRAENQLSVLRDSGVHRGQYSGVHRGQYSGVHKGQYSGVHRGQYSGVHMSQHSGVHRGQYSGVHRGQYSGYTGVSTAGYTGVNTASTQRSV